MRNQTRTFLKGSLTGALFILVLSWVFPEILFWTGGGGPALDLEGLSSLERMRKTGVARIGFANEAPYAYLDPATGRLTGEAPEVARVVLQRLGVERVEGVLTEFGAMIPGLKAERFDIIAAGMYITPPRCEEVDFSNPTYGIGEALVVRAGNPENLHSYKDFIQNPNATLGVVTGAIQRNYALDVGIPSEQIKVFPDAPSAIEGVGKNRVDAYGGTSLTVNDLLGKADNPNLERAEPFQDPVIDGREVRGYGAFAFRKADDELRQAFNRELKHFIGSDEHLELVAPFGFTDKELPGDATAAELCRPTKSQNGES